MTPMLTAINQPVSEMAATALTLLLDRLQEHDRLVRHSTVDVKLVVRESVTSVRYRTSSSPDARDLLKPHRGDHADIGPHNHMPIDGNQ